MNLGYVRRRIAVEISKRYRWLEYAVHPTTALVLALEVPLDLPSAAEWMPVMSVAVACGRLFFPAFKIQRIEREEDVPEPADPNTMYWWPEARS